MKVSEAANGAGKLIHYDHGSKSLEDVAIQLASDFVGSGNVCLIRGEGSFTSRAGAKSAAAARYISIVHEPLASCMVRAEDLQVARRQISDGELVEPEVLPTVLPLFLLNGVRCGISVGFNAMFVPFAPFDVLAATRAFAELGAALRRRGSSAGASSWLQEGTAAGIAEAKQFLDRFWAMRMHFVGFGGRVEASVRGDKARVTVRGSLRCTGTVGRSGVVIQIEDLPCTVFADTVESVLSPGTKEAAPWIKDMNNGLCKAQVQYTLRCDAEGVYREAGLDPLNATWNDLNAPGPRAKLERCLGLENAQNLTQFNLSLASGAVVSEDDLLSVFMRWADVRMEVYERRHRYSLDLIRFHATRASQRARYIREIRSGALSPQAFGTVAELEAELAAMGFRPDVELREPSLPSRELLDNDSDDEDEEAGVEADGDHLDDEEESKKGEPVGTYSHLIELRTADLTLARAQQLERAASGHEEVHEQLRKIRPVDLWIQDIRQLEPELARYQRDRAHRKSYEPTDKELRPSDVVPTKPLPSVDSTSSKFSVPDSGAGVGSSTGT